MLAHSQPYMPAYTHTKLKKTKKSFIPSFFFVFPFSFNHKNTNDLQTTLGLIRQNLYSKSWLNVAKGKSMDAAESVCVWGGN